MNYLKNPLPVCTCPAIVPYFRLVMFHDVWGNSKEIHVSYIPWQYKWADVWSTHHTIEPDWRVAIFCWIKKIRGNFSIHIPNEVNKWKKNVISKKKKKTHVMTLASSMKSSSDIVPLFIILTAVSIDPRHFPWRTTPNWPDPNSSSSINSDGWISHLSCDKPAVGGTGRSHGDDFRRQAKPPELWRW